MTRRDKKAEATLCARRALIAVELSKQALVDSHDAIDLAERMTRAFTDANNVASDAITEHAGVQALYEGTVDDALTGLHAIYPSHAKGDDNDEQRA